MKTSFLQNLENLNLDGEAFLAQFLEFLLDQSLSGNKKYDSLIWSTAQVLDLKLPISTITSAFALLQVKISENKIGQNTVQTRAANITNTNHSTNSTFSQPNYPIGGEKSQANNWNQNQNNYNSNFEKPPANLPNSTKTLQSLNPNCIQKVDLEETETERFETEYSEIEGLEELIIEKKSEKTVNTLNNGQNFGQNNQQLTQKTQTPQSEIKSEVKKVEISNSQNSQNSQSVSLSQVHNFLISSIKNTKESAAMNLKLLLSDLALEKIDLGEQTGILTLSSGALLNFLKNKKSLDWIAKVLLEEFGWSIELTAVQRETKTILFANDTLLPILKNNYQHTFDKNSPNSPNLSNSKNPQITNSQPINLTKTPIQNPENLEKAGQKTENPKAIESAKKEVEKPQNEPELDKTSNEESTKFYKLFSQNSEFPFNFADKNVELIKKIPLAIKEEINWEEFGDDFELE